MIYCPCFHSKTNLFFSAIVTFITSDCTEELAKIIVQLDEHWRELPAAKVTNSCLLSIIKSSITFVVTATQMYALKFMSDLGQLPLRLLMQLVSSTKINLW